MTTSNIIVIPKLIDKLSIKENPLYKIIKKESNEYIMKNLNLQNFDNNLAYWSCICYPDIIIKERIYNITNFYTLLFIIDDILENNVDNNINAKRYIDILENDIDSNNIIEKTFKNICNSIKKDLTDSQKIRFIEYTKEWIEGANELANFNNNIDKNTYMYYRFKSIGARSSFISIEYGFNLCFENEILEEYKEIHKIAAENIIFINDLFSYRKEIYDNIDNPNIIKIIMNERKCNLQESINLLEIEIKENYKKYKISCNKILNKYNNENIKKYLDGLYSLIIGNLQWSCVSPRYHGIGFEDTLINGANVIFEKNKTIIVNN